MKSAYEKGVTMNAAVKWRKRIGLSVLASVSSLVTVLAAAGSASAATDYKINVTQACRYTYNNYSAWADYVNYGNPFSWVCRVNSYSASVPAGVGVTVTTLGGVDMQKYCNVAHRGTKAVIVTWNAFGWKCRG